MVWQPAEGGEAVSAAEWSRVASGEAPVKVAEEAGKSGADKPEEAIASGGPEPEGPVEQKPDESVVAGEPGEPESTA